VQKKKYHLRVSSHFWSEKYRIIGIFCLIYRVNIGILEEIYMNI